MDILRNLSGAWIITAILALIHITGGGAGRAAVEGGRGGASGGADEEVGIVHIAVAVLVALGGGRLALALARTLP